MRMIDRFAQLPNALKERAHFVHLGGGDEPVPALIAHPDPAWREGNVEPAPFVYWVHGRTVSKELDPGRYLRWVRNGIGVCAVDLPGHGERFDRSLQVSEQTLAVAERAVGEVDLVLADLRERFGGAFDFDRIGMGGMSAGGVVTLVRCCSGHPFSCVAVEATVGDFSAMEGRRFFVEPYVTRMNPMTHLDGWRAVPFLALHSEIDEWIPVEGIRSFAAELRNRYAGLGVDPETVRVRTWPETGAPYEHAGFGKVSNEAKNLQVDFFREHLV